MTGEVKSACCSCVAGKVGFCNHVLAFMFKMCKFTLYNCTSAKELSEEQDQQSSLACTSQLQQWQRKGGGKNIGPQPIMEVEVIKTKIDESRSRSGLKSLLYDARMKTTHNEAKEEEFKRKLKIMNPNNGLSQMASEQSVATNDNGYKETRFGKCRVGSFLSYQVALTESNFEATASVNCIPSVQLTSNQTLLYPRFPLRNIEEMVVPGNLSEDEKQLLHTIQIEKDKINEIERQTRDQAESDKWREERKFRFTALKFHLISKRQRNHKTFAETLINPTSVTSKYLEHGKKLMCNRRTPVKVLPSGFVVSKGSPVIGTTPDARVVDFSCTDHFGIAEVKCPYTKHQVTPLDACSDAKFCMEKTNNTESKLKVDHPYYAQVQGQMTVTGARWCDFIVYTSRGLYVQRITHDPVFWTELNQKLVSYYFTHFIKFASVILASELSSK